MKDSGRGLRGRRMGHQVGQGGSGVRVGSKRHWPVVLALKLGSPSSPGADEAPLVAGRADTLDGPLEQLLGEGCSPVGAW